MEADLNVEEIDFELLEKFLGVSLRKEELKKKTWINSSIEEKKAKGQELQIKKYGSQRVRNVNGTQQLGSKKK